MNTPIETRELGLKFQISDLKCYPNQKGFAVATIDGRVSMEYFDSSPQFQAMNRFTFKCHRSHDKASGSDIVHCVNSIAFHPTHGTLFTSGSDGGLCLWDVEKRKRMKMFPRFSDPIMKIACNDTMVAVATSDDKFTRMSKISAEGSQISKPSKVHVLHLSTTDCMPKKRS
jgi:cell cycle arrest protein BUB3